MIGLTDRQREVLGVIVRLISENEAPPTWAEIGAELGVSSQTAGQHCSALARKGRILIRPGVARGIRVLDASEVRDG